MDSDLSGLLVGATLGTRPHEIYRALIEATAFGTRKIIDAFTSKGVAIDELHACGGLAQKNPLLRRLVVDHFGVPHRVCDSDEDTLRGLLLLAMAATKSSQSLAAAGIELRRDSVKHE